MRVLLLAKNLRPNASLLALGCLKSAVECDDRLRGQVLVEVEGLRSDEGVDRILELTRQHEPALVGFSCYVWNLSLFLEACRALKAERPDVKTVLGGPKVTPEPRRVLEGNPAVDAVISGEGELAFRRTLAGLVSGSARFREVAGLCFRDGENIVERPPGPPIREWSAAPSPYLSGALRIGPDTHVLLETQRGCPHRCTYCYYRKGLSAVRFVPWERVRSELDLVFASGVRLVSFLDPTFNSDRSRARRICQYVAEHNEHTEFHAEVRAEWVDDELAEWLARANVRFLEVGIQSTDPESLRRIGRPTNLDDLKEGIACLRRRGLVVEAQLIAGLPGETLDTLKRSIGEVDAMASTKITVFPLLLLPGTELRAQRARHGILCSEEPPYEIVSSWTFPERDLARAMKIADALAVFGAFSKCVALIRRETGLRMLELFSLWEEWLEGLKAAERAAPPVPPAAIRFREFLGSLCVSRGIDARFYSELAEAEQRAQERALISRSP